MFGQKPNTIKNLLLEKPKSCLETDNTLQLSPEDFPKDDDSTILMRNKTRNTKLEGQFAKKKGQIVSESEHTITMATPRGRQVISKRDVAKLKKPKSASHSPQTKQTKQQQGNSHSLERKIAALKEAARKQNKRETKQEQEPTEKTDYKRKDIPKPIQSPRKQIKPRKSPSGPPETKPEEMNLFEQSSDEEEAQKQHEETQIEKKEKTTRHDEPTTSKNEQTPARRIKKKPNWYGQNVMIQKLEEDEKERSDTQKSETKTEEDLRRETSWK